MANYTKTTDFAAKDTLPGGDTNKVIRGSEFETEFDAISTAIATKSDTAGPTFTGTTTIPTADINGGNIDGTVIGASSAAAGTFTNLTASGTVNFNGATVSNLGTITTANLDGGTADNIVIGGATPAAGSFTTLAASSSLTVGGTAVLTSVAFSNIDAGAITTSGETFADSDTQIPTNAAVKDHVEAVIPTLSVTESSVTAHQAALAIAATQITSLTSSVSELNILDGVTSTATELNLLDGVTATTAEINYLDGVTSNIQTQFNAISPSPTFTATASGALANGDTVIVNSDGTVSAVSTTLSALDPPTKGTAAEFEAGGTGSITAVFDPDTNKVVVAYADAGDSEKGKVAIGTVSGTSISFGTPVEFNSGVTQYIRITYDTNVNRIVIAYADFAAGGHVIVGTVSGTSASFGTRVQHNAAETTYHGITFDSSNNKVVITFRDNGNSNYGTAMVGTVDSSDNSISLGSEVVFNAGNTFYAIPTFDSSNNKVVIAYRDQGDSNKGKAIVGTVSGTSISFGTAVVFDGNNGSEWTSATFDSNSNKVVIFYQDDTDTETNAIVGTVSGTSISFGTAVQVLDGNNVYHSATFNSDANTVLVVLREETTNDIELFVGTVSGTSISFVTGLKVAENAAQVAVVYDTNAQKGVVFYDDDDDSSKGKGVVTTVNGTGTTLTTENYVGIADAAYSNTNTATIQTVGAVDDAQSSLTPGQLYYIQNDGSLSTTAATPSVVAGVAISSTKLLISRA